MTLIHLQCGYNPLYDSQSFEIAVCGVCFVLRWYGPMYLSWHKDGPKFKAHVGVEWLNRAIWKYEVMK